MSIQLIVGLGNPGTEYEATRHNAGAWFVECLAAQYKTTLRLEAKFKGLAGIINYQGNECRLLIPTTYMNNSGIAVQAVTAFYKIPVNNILVAYDELDFAPGTIRLKQDGGTNKHKGLISIAAPLGNNFYRLRIGIGKPENKDRMSDYVLSPPTADEKKQITAAIDDVLKIVPQILTGDMAKAMQFCNTKQI